MHDRFKRPNPNNSRDTQLNPSVAPPDHDPFAADTQPRPFTQQRLPRRRRRPRWILALVVVIAVVFALMVLLAESRSGPAGPIEVSLIVDGEITRIETEADTVADLLGAQSVNLDAGDLLEPGLMTELEDGATVSLRRARSVSLTVDGMTSILRTVNETPYDILNNAGIALNPGDRVTVEGTAIERNQLLTWPVPVTNIVVESAVSVTVIDGDATRELRTTEDTVGALLAEAGIDLYVLDTVVPDVASVLEDGLTITIDRSRELTVVADGVRQETRTNAVTVADALDDLGVTLSGLDYAIPAEDSDIQPGMIVRVIRVREEIINEDERIAFETVYQADAELELDDRRVIQAGQAGLQQRVIRVRYENGIEISRDVETDEMIQVPQNQIVAYGTNIVIRTLNTPEGPVQYWRKLRMYATSYHPEALGGDNVTSVGETLRKGIIAIDPRIVPYYTNMYVEGYGQGIAADTGGPRSNPYWVDLGYEDHDWENWHWWQDVYLLTPVPDNVTYLLPETSRGGPVR